MEPLTDLDEARRVIQSHAGPPETLNLPIADSLNDPGGMIMAILLDACLAKGWEPDRFDQSDGYRIYRYIPSTED